MNLYELNDLIKAIETDGDDYCKNVMLPFYYEMRDNLILQLQEGIKEIIVAELGKNCHLN